VQVLRHPSMSMACDCGASLATRVSSPRGMKTPMLRFSDWTTCADALAGRATIAAVINNPTPTTFSV